MPGNKEGAKKANATKQAKYGSWKAYNKRHKELVEKAMIKRFGSIEAWKEHQRKWGGIGGKAKNPNKGFGFKKNRGK